MSSRFLQQKGNTMSQDDDFALSWVCEMLGRGERRRFIVDEAGTLITPAMAAALLTLNTANRGVSRARVEQHVRRLRAGAFILTHQGISVSGCGTLNDGQHRLRAIVETGISAPVMVTFGASRDEFYAVDGGKPRDAADLLTIKGRANASSRAAIVGVLYRLHVSSQPDAQAITAYDDKLDSPELERATASSKLINTARVCPGTAAGVAYYTIVKHSLSAALVDDFFEGLRTGEMLARPRLRLREWLMRGELATLSSYTFTVERAAVTILCWNAWIKGRVRFDEKWGKVSSLPDVR